MIFNVFARLNLINKSAINMPILFIMFYFLVAQNNATNHAMPVQPNVQLAKRTRVMSVLSFLVWRAIHAGANIIAATIAIAAAYFIPSKI